MGKTLPQLTRRQKDTLDYINSFSIEHGYAPSMYDLALGIGLTNASTAQYHVEQLKRKGYLKKKSKKARGVTVTTPPQTIPLLGVIAAGVPIEPVENPETISVPSQLKLKPSYQYYALRISGDSMIDMGILDGDTALIRHQFNAEIGDVVVAITENGATLKTYKKDGKGRVRLEARNKQFRPIYPKRFEIRGVFEGLIRSHSSAYV
jgi:SOS regulatory protein LexA